MFNLRYWVIACALGVLVLLFACTSSKDHASDVTLIWDPVADAAGYKVYYGIESRVYISAEDAGPATTHTVSLGKKSGHYFFAVTAYNQFGESDFSNEVDTLVSR